MKEIVVIGAGFSGLATACYLAKAGYSVTIVEKNAWVGGRAHRVTDKGFSFDFGPSWYWMPEVFEQFFTDFGKNVAEYYTLKRLSPSYRVVFNDEMIDLPTKRADQVALFEKLETGAGEKLSQFLKKTQRTYELAMRYFVPYPFRSLKDLLDPTLILAGIKLLLNYNGFQSAHRFYNHQFSSLKIRKLLEFPLFFLAGSPKAVPAVYSLMNHVDLNLGTWYPHTGFNAVIDGMVKLATELGVTIHCNCEVQSVTLRENQVTAVHTSDGRRFPVDVLVASGDYKFIETSLLPKKLQSYSSKYWDTLTLAPSALLVHLGIRKKIPGLLHHTLFFHNDWDEGLKELNETPNWPKKPLYYVSCPSKTDPTVAPKGQETLTILIPLSAGLPDSIKKREQLSSSIIADLEDQLHTDIHSHIVIKKLYGISEFISDFHAHKGNAYGIAHTFKQTAMFRPQFQSKKVSNLFYTGQSTIPGIGVPICLLSGRIVSKEIQRRYGSY
ncbi:phytoene desaturase [Candidatus Woesebacteria bacterium]|nr:phytoene desaturase [Candidatus Woesebacteria bacterium]